MIGMLRGLVCVRSAEVIMVDVSGVGYELTCPLTTVEQLPDVGCECTLFVRTRIRDDQITLFGFSTLSLRENFELLLTLRG